MVTGTNGKTLTTALISEIFRQEYDHVLTNASGANMEQGIVSAFLSDISDSETGRKLAVLEVDEGSLKRVTSALSPDCIVFNNLFEDQLDRYGSLDQLKSLLTDAALMAPQAKLVVNGDLPDFGQLHLPNEMIYFGSAVDLAPSDYATSVCPLCQQPLHYQLRTYANLGHYECPAGHFRRPALDYSLTHANHIGAHQTTFDLDYHPFELAMGGVYNIYNALAAYSVARLYDIPITSIQAGIAGLQPPKGRQETLDYHGRQLQLNLVKNQVGFDAVLQLLDMEQAPYSLVVLMNNDYADGQDISWIHEANFESIAQTPVQEIICGGSCFSDLKHRFYRAGFEDDQVIELTELKHLPEALNHCSTTRVHILASFTAMNTLQKLLK